MSLHIIDPSPLRQEPKPTKVRLHTTQAGPGVDTVHTEAVKPFAMIPHGIASDPRLSATDVRVVLALTHWGWLSGPRADLCTMATARLAEYARVSKATIKRSLENLESFGFIRRDSVPITSGNATGRVITLVWLSDPAVIPDPPRRSAQPDHGGVGSPVSRGGLMDEPGGAHPCTGGRLTSEPGGGSPVSPNEELRKEPEDDHNTGVVVSRMAKGGDGGESGAVVTPPEVAESVELAVRLFGVGNEATEPDVIRRNVVALCDKHGSSIALKALRVTEKKAAKEEVGFGHTIATARRMAETGGTISSTTPRPKPVPPATVPIVVTSRPEPDDDTKWAEWFGAADADVRFKFGEADEATRKAVRDKVVNAPSPPVVETKVRVMLGLHAMPAIPGWPAPSMAWMDSANPV